jgi:putative NADH-flavin reductase
MLLVIFGVYALLLSVALGVKGVHSKAGAPVPAADQHSMRVLIVGATGGTGRQLVSQALDRGHHVTALARNPAALQIEHPRLHVVRGNVLEPASVEEAMRGQDAVISALGHKRFFGPTRILSEGTRTLLRAMETQGVSRFVCETALGIGSSAGRMGLSYTLFVIPAILPFYFWDKTRQEQLIAASRVDWIIVRPGGLTNGASRGTYRHGAGIGSFLWTVRISRADVADFMLNQLTDNAYLKSAPGVCW